MRLPSVSRIAVGRLGSIDFAPGWYLYVGSAFGPGGVRARCRHHQKISPRPRWHIDYLRAQCDLHEIWYTHDVQRREHRWAGLLSRMGGIERPREKFGASDCDCPTHLFYASDKPGVDGFRQLVLEQLSGHAPVKCKVLLH